MRLTLVNQTDSPILCRLVSTTDPLSDRPQLQIALLPSSSTTTDLPKRCSKLSLSPREHFKYDSSSEFRSKEEGMEPMLEVRVQSKAQSRAWGMVAGDWREGWPCPWRIYRMKISRNHNRLLILPRRDLCSFLSDVPDTVPISSLLLPGTHDTMAFYGWPISQCQSQLTSNPLLHQLQSGIRALDIRLSIQDGRLISFHGIYPERTPFTSILSTLYQFLTTDDCGGKRECIVVSIKQEDRASPLFTALVHSEIGSSPGGKDIWYTESNRIPTLGEVRGKCVLFSRFGEADGPELGIHPDRWPDSRKEGFEWNCGDTPVRVSDWYAIPSFLYIPEKVALSTSILLPPPTTTLPPTLSPSQNTLSITFFSASSFPFALPPIIARGFGWPTWGFGVTGVNERVGGWLLEMFSGTARDNYSCSHSRSHFLASDMVNGHKTRKIEGKKAVGEPRIRGWTYMDFYEYPVESDVASLLVECNFRGRKVGEEGWIDQRGCEINPSGVFTSICG